METQKINVARLRFESAVVAKWSKMPFTQMVTCYTIKPSWHNCGLNTQMLIIVGEYYDFFVRRDVYCYFTWRHCCYKGNNTSN